MMTNAKPRRKRCRSCREWFQPWSTTQTACSPICAMKVAAEKKAKREKRRLVARKQALKPRAKLLAEAQTAFNAFIRLRDDGLPCISCGVTNPPERHGGAWDCGHYLTRGAHPELRFNEDNAHRQCKSCNGGAGNWSGKSRTVQQDYRHRLIERIGLERVEALEGPQDPAKWSRDELVAIKKDYQRKKRELKAARCSTQPTDRSEICNSIR